jgi:hypothetical protein
LPVAIGSRWRDANLTLTDTNTLAWKSTNA